MTPTSVPNPDRAPSLDDPESATAVLPNGNGEPEENGGPGPLGRRVFRPETLVSFGLAVAILLFFVRRLDIHPDEIWAVVRTANPVVYALAFVVWYGAFGLREARWRRMLEAAGVDGERLPRPARLTEILVLSWFANCVVPAKLGDAYRAFLLKNESRVPFSTSLGTIVTERLADLSVLFVMMSAVGLVLFHGQIPTEASQTFLLGLVLVVAAVGVLVALWFTRHSLQRYVPARFRDQYARLHDAMFRSLRRPAWVLVPAVAIWIVEGLRFWFVSQSLDAGIPFAVALFVALMGSLLTTIPLTPAGLGVVEAGTGAVLVSVFRIDPSMALAIILLDRVVAYWALIAVGLVLYVRRLRRPQPAATPASAAPSRFDPAASIGPGDD